MNSSEVERLHHAVAELDLERAHAGDRVGRHGGPVRRIAAGDRAADLAAAGVAGGRVVERGAGRRGDRRGEQRRPLRAAGVGVAHAGVADERQDVDQHEVLHRHRADVLHPQAVLEGAAGERAGRGGDRSRRRRCPGWSCWRPAGRCGATVMVPVARQRVSAVSPSPSSRGRRPARCRCSAGRGRRASLSRVKSFDRLPAGAPLRMVVETLIHTCWLTPRLPLPAFQRQRSSVRPVPAKFGIWSKTCGAGRPVLWSSNVQAEKTRVDRQQVGGDEVRQRHRVAGARVAAHPQAPGDGLAGVERTAAGEVLLRRVELHERAAHDEALAGVAVDVGRTGRVDGGEVGAVLDRVADGHRAAGVVRVDDRPVISGRVLAAIPGCAWPYSQRMRVRYSPAPRPGGGAVSVVLVVVFGELPQRVKTPSAVFFS